MGHSTRLTRAVAIGAGVAFGIFSATALPAVATKKAAAPSAQGAGGEASEAAQKQQAAAAAKNNYENGVKQYQAGKYPAAVDNLSAALRGGGLASTDMARALYIRGLAYKKQSKPGLAISDLTSALWLKNGLNDADRASATAERAEAYRLAGLGEAGPVGESAGVSVATPTPAASPAAAAPAVVAKPTKSKHKSDAAIAAAAPAAVPSPLPQAEITRQAPDSEAAQDAARARKMAAATPVDSGGLQSAANAGLVNSVQTANVAALAPAAPAAAAAQSANAPVLTAAPIDAATETAAAPASGSPVGNFFSNLFNGNAAASPAAEPVTTASTTLQPATSSWSDTTSVASGGSKPGSAAKGVKQAAAASAPAAPVIKGGKYKIHIAAVRSREEAEAIAQKVQAQSGPALKSRSASVDEAVIGSMGKFYRVRVGTFATADEPRGVCNTLRSSGFDCLVVTN